MGETVERRLALQKTIAAISSRFVGVVDVDDAINASLMDIGRLSGASRAYVFLFHGGCTGMDNTHEWCAEGVSPQKERLQHLACETFPWWMARLRRGDAIHIKDVATLPDDAAAEKEILESQHARSLLVLPLAVGGELAGFIGFDNVVATGIWGDDDVALLRICSEVIGNAIERRRMEETLRLHKTISDAQSEASIDGTLVVTADRKILSFNRRFVEMWGIPDEVMATRLSEAAVHYVEGKLADPQEFLDRVAHLYGRPDEESREEIRLKDGRTFDRYSAPVRSADGICHGRVWFFRDITKRKRAEEALRFLATASAVLASSLDYAATLEKVVRLVVPYLADWCIVDVVEEDGTIERLAVACADPAREDLAQALRRYPPAADGAGGVARVLRTGQSEIYPELTDSLLVAAARDAEHLKVIRQMGGSSRLIVPLRARGRTLGAITFISSESGRRYGPADLALAEDLARRAALAVDNALLFQEAQEAIHVRDEFLAWVSHDLKNPLGAIKGQAQLLQRRVARLAMPDGERIVAGLATIDAMATKMTALINELLDVARLQMGEPLTLEPRPTDLVALAQVVAAAHQAGTERHCIRVVAAVDKLVGTWDGDRVERVLGNLLSNALKYSPAGCIVTVRVDCEVEAGSAWAVLQVRDHGVGIPAADLPRVFERFHRGTNVVGQIAGTGLGLAGARQIVEQHGGSISVASEEGAGSTFTVRLPLNEWVALPGHGDATVGCSPS